MFPCSTLKLADILVTKVNILCSILFTVPFNSFILNIARDLFNIKLNQTVQTASLYCLLEC